MDNLEIAYNADKSWPEANVTSSECYGDCGSGHILVEAYELFKAIYLERGYRQRDVPQLILEKNLFGLDIDERAAQLAGFALMMKGRADDRRLLERGVKLNVMALVDSAAFDAEALASLIPRHSHEGGNIELADLAELKRLFECATTFGSLIQLPDCLAKKLPGLAQLCEVMSQDLFVSDAVKRLGPLVRQAEILAAKYDAVVANPPYMGSKFQSPKLKKYLKERYGGYDKDIFSAFIAKNQELAKGCGCSAFMTPMVWMFLSSHEQVRRTILDEHTLGSLVQLEYNASGAVRVPLCTFVIPSAHIDGFRGSYVRLTEFAGEQRQGPMVLEAIRNPNCGWLYRAKPDDFKKIPGSPVAYWISDNTRDLFNAHPQLGEVADARQGLATTDNGRFVRHWHEVECKRIGFNIPNRAIAIESGKRWFPFNKGGAFRKWFGNQELIVNWEKDGAEIKELIINKYPYLKGNPEFVAKNPRYYFRSAVSWSDVTSSHTSFREYSAGFVPGNVGHCAYGGSNEWRRALLAYCNNKFVGLATTLLCPSLHFDVGYFKKIPYPELAWSSGLVEIADTCVALSEIDWNSYERSWDFQSLPIVPKLSDLMPSLESIYIDWITKNRDSIAEVKRLEEENNRIFIDTYGLGEELTSDVPIEQITLTVNPAYRYGGKLTEEQLWDRFREDSMQELISYAIGCMMGRYSLDAPGLIYAHSGNEGFAPSSYTSFPADDDGIVPLTDTEWYADDAANRVVEFISVAWDEKNLETNLDFLASNLSPKKGESSRDTIRRYLCDKFYKDHMQTYKKRPIYWLFSSGKQKAFQCLVYLHRYNEGTLARMRTEYVIPLTAKLSSHIDKLDNDKLASGSAAEIKKLEKEIKRLQKQQTELTEFDEKLKHLADQRIKLDLDDGVKVNYGKFGDLLADVKAIHGKVPR